MVSGLPTRVPFKTDSAAWIRTAIPLNGGGPQVQPQVDVAEAVVGLLRPPVPAECEAVIPGRAHMLRPDVGEGWDRLGGYRLHVTPATARPKRGYPNQWCEQCSRQLFSHRVESQALPSMGLRSGGQGTWSRSPALRMRSRLRMAATRAPLRGLSRRYRRVWQSRMAGLWPCRGWCARRRARPGHGAGPGSVPASPGAQACVRPLFILRPRGVRLWACRAVPSMEGCRHPVQRYVTLFCTGWHQPDGRLRYRIRWLMIAFAIF